MIQKLKEIYYKRKAEKLIKNEAFEEALKYVTKISSKEKQEHVIWINLVAYAISKVANYVEFTTDKKRYECFKYIVGSSSDKRLFYIDPKTDEIDESCLEDIVKEIIALDNPLLKYLHESLEKST